MVAIKAYFEYFIKSLLLDKLNLIWSILLPVLTLLVYQNNIYSIETLSFWWTYMLVNYYVFGVGIFALQLKESGTLRSIFSFNSNSLIFFLGLLTTQLAYSFLGMFVFNIAAALLLHFDFLKLFVYSIAQIIICVPVAFIAFAFTKFEKIHAKTITTVAGITLFILFILLQFQSRLIVLNPLYFLSQVLFSTNSAKIYGIFLIVSLLIGIPSIKNFSCLSNEVR